MSCPVDAVQTFVMTLMTDDVAQCAFGANPVGTLAAAGLSELTPADLRDAVPSVSNQVPVPAADALASALPALPDGGDPTTAVVAHLKALITSAQAVPVSGGELPIYASALSAVPAAHPNLGEFDAAVSGSAAGATAAAWYTAPGADAAAAIRPDGLALSAVAGPTAGSPVGLGDSVTVHTGSAAVGAHSASALGSYHVAVAANPTVPNFGATGDPAATLDSLVFGNADAAASAAAGYVAGGRTLAAGTLTTGSHTVGEALANGGATAGHAVASGGADLGSHIGAGTTTVADTVAHAHATPIVPTLDIPTGVPATGGHHVEHHTPSPGHAPAATEFGHEVHQSLATAGVAHSPLAPMSVPFDHAATLADCTDAHTGHSELLLGH